MPSAATDLACPAPVAAIVVPPPSVRPMPAFAAEPAVPLPPWTAAPAGSTTRIFREVLVGKLPARAYRNTWWLLSSSAQAYLRMEEQRSTSALPVLDRTSHFPTEWSAPIRSEYVGSLTRTTPPFTLKLQRRFGPHEPAALTMDCAAKTIAVHPAFATVVEGWKNDDDTMEPATWAPARTERVAAVCCKPVGSDWSFPFAEGLCFASGKTTAKEQTAGVEWAFVNSDMVIQQGGYRFIPNFAVAAP
jgi:hypothetical protein